MELLSSGFFSGINIIVVNCQGNGLRGSAASFAVGEMDCPSVDAGVKGSFVHTNTVCEHTHTHRIQVLHN